MMEWQDIESAPRDGTPVLICAAWSWANGSDGKMIVVGQYDVRACQWCFVTPPNYWNAMDDDITLEAWMPLPPPPKEQPHD